VKGQAALTSSAAQVAGLGRIYFDFFCLDLHGSNRFPPEGAETGFLIIRFLFSYTGLLS
jgi:hypothetical protein